MRRRIRAMFRADTMEIQDEKTIKALIHCQCGWRQHVIINRAGEITLPAHSCRFTARGKERQMLAVEYNVES